MRSAGQASHATLHANSRSVSVNIVSIHTCKCVFMDVTLYMCSAPAPAERTGMASFIDQEKVNLKER